MDAQRACDHKAGFATSSHDVIPTSSMSRLQYADPAHELKCSTWVRPAAQN